MKKHKGRHKWIKAERFGERTIWRNGKSQLGTIYCEMLCEKCGKSKEGIPYQIIAVCI